MLHLRVYPDCNASECELKMGISLSGLARICASHAFPTLSYRAQLGRAHKWRHESLTMEPLPVALKKRFGLLVATGLLGRSLPRTIARSS
jgi:hypothetical protein